MNFLNYYGKKELYSRIDGSKSARLWKVLLEHWLRHFTFTNETKL